MKYFGLDYGTTNSLFYGYDNSKFIEICNTPSAVIVANGKVEKVGFDACDAPDRTSRSFVESPKLGIIENNLEYRENGVTVNTMIETLLGEMIKKGKMESDSHITLTVPNRYAAPHYLTMQNILTHCLNEAFDNNHNIQIHLLPEPVAAALFYVHKHFSELPNVCQLVICDIGGGTTDLCLVEFCKRNRELTFRVNKDGMQHADIGGNDFDKAISQTITFPAGLSENEKRNLIYLIKSHLSIKERFIGHSISFKREDFETCISAHTNRLEKLMRMMLEESKLEVNNSWYIIPIGGTCQIPIIRKLLEEVFAGAHQTYEYESTIFNSVAQGASIYSAWRAHALNTNQYDSINIEHRTPHDIQFQTAYGAWHTLVAKNAVDGAYPEGSQNNIELCSHDIIIKDGKYTVREIVLKEGESELKRTHSIPFSLRNREIKDITLQLGVEIENCRIKKWWIKDTFTNEIENWTLQ